MKVLIVVDMQKDFVNGALGSKEAVAITQKVAQKVMDFDGLLVATYDTHDENYLNTQEGQLLPVPHCVMGTDGWQITDVVLQAIRSRHGDYKEFHKSKFGSIDLAKWLAEVDKQEAIEEIELVGVCTDICVVSNALLLKAFLPEVKISVDASCCAGVTPEAHEAALKTMRSCQIFIENWKD